MIALAIRWSNAWSQTYLTTFTVSYVGMTQTSFLTFPYVDDGQNIITWGLADSSWHSYTAKGDSSSPSFPIPGFIIDLRKAPTPSYARANRHDAILVYKRHWGRYRISAFQNAQTLKEIAQFKAPHNKHSLTKSLSMQRINPISFNARIVDANQQKYTGCVRCWSQV